MPEPKIFQKNRCSVMFTVCILGLFGKPDMNKFNSVFVKKINNQTGSVFQSDGLTLRGETVQLFNDISTDGIIIFGFQLCSQSLINIIKLCGALELHILCQVEFL